MLSMETFFYCPFDKIQNRYMESSEFWSKPYFWGNG
ncbi:hypothetical protein Echvi_0843 [Echinicola vietnamensis DSM 17526]|uniref:Uncharacterized protein n=1 Tax=Echinicola vietnamensis (strain DSM 17526 / LMG 23754 / KMM 6221) TaxID=926556 RepID=L0FWI9_ECHVK|nr:hypothetical protein Echvi_0843 [Echinicola vietnamensis DSM 17526]